jgi:hypothetical protein
VSRTIACDYGRWPARDRFGGACRSRQSRRLAVPLPQRFLSSDEPDDTIAIAGSTPCQVSAASNRAAWALVPVPSGRSTRFANAIGVFALILRSQ